MRDALDRHITGNYGEDQFLDQEDYMNRAVVLHSGGQDSTTCLGWAIEEWGRDSIWTVSFDYGQRHRVETQQADVICDELGIPPERRARYTIEALAQLAGAALTNRDIEVNVNAQGSGNVFAEEHDLPSTFVPGRNVLFLTLALAYGAKRGIYDLVTGVCETDRAGYPDCRQEFVGAIEETLRIALDEPAVTIHAPLLQRSKAETFQLAQELGILELVLEETHTCYHGDRSHRFDWGYGCGDCGACIERRDGWESYQYARRAP